MELSFWMHSGIGYDSGTPNETLDESFAASEISGNLLWSFSVSICFFLLTCITIHEVTVIDVFAFPLQTLDQPLNHTGHFPIASSEHWHHKTTNYTPYFDWLQTKVNWHPPNALVPSQVWLYIPHHLKRKNTAYLWLWRLQRQSLWQFFCLSTRWTANHC